MRPTLCVFTPARWAAAAVMWAVLAALHPGNSVLAQSTAPEPGPGGDETFSISFVPPDRGAPATRIGGGTRSQPGHPTITLEAIAPADTGLSASPSPVLHWYQSAPLEPGLTIEIAITDVDAIDPALEVSLAADETAAGFNQIDLSALGVALAPDTQYRWTIGIVRDGDWLNAQFASAGVMHATTAEHPSGSPVDAAGAWAARGYWFDAWHILVAQSQAGAVQPAVLSDLLASVGLPNAAAALR